MELPFKIRGKFNEECQSLGIQNFDNDFDDLRSTWSYNHVINRLNQVMPCWLKQSDILVSYAINEH